MLKKVSHRLIGCALFFALSSGASIKAVYTFENFDEDNERIADLRYRINLSIRDRREAGSMVEELRALLDRVERNLGNIALPAEPTLEDETRLDAARAAVIIYRMAIDELVPVRPTPAPRPAPAPVGPVAADPLQEVRQYFPNLDTNVNEFRHKVGTYGEAKLTALGFAVHTCNERAVAELLSRGANPNLGNERGTTPLMMAINSGCEQAIEYLLAHRYIDIHARNQAGQTALITAENKLKAAKEREQREKHQRIRDIINERAAATR